MAYVTPTIRNAGDAILASDQNIWANNMISLYGSIRRLAYQTRTTNYSISSSTTGAAADVFSTDLSWTADGSTYMVQWWFPYLDVGTASVPRLILVDGSGNDLGWLSVATTGIQNIPQGTTWYTPAAGTATLNLRANNGGSGTGTIGMGTSASGAYHTGWMAVWGPALA